MFQSKLINSILYIIYKNKIELSNITSFSLNEPSTILNSRFGSDLNISFLDSNNKKDFHTERVLIRSDFEFIDLKKNEHLVILLILQYYKETSEITENYVKDIMTKKVFYSNIIYYMKALNTILENKLLDYFDYKLPLVENPNKIKFHLLDGIDFYSVMKFDRRLNIQDIELTNLINSNVLHSIEHSIYNSSIEQDGISYFYERFKGIKLTNTEEEYLKDFLESRFKDLSEHILDKYIIPFLLFISESYGNVIDFEDLILDHNYDSMIFNIITINDYISSNFGISLLDGEYNIVEENVSVNSFPDFIYLLIQSSDVITRDIIKEYNKGSFILYYEKNYSDVYYEELDKFLFDTNVPYFIQYNGIQYNNPKGKNYIAFSSSFIKELTVILTEIVLTKFYYIITTNFSKITAKEVEKNLQGTSTTDIERGLNDYYYYSSLVDILINKGS